MFPVIKNYTQSYLFFILATVIPWFLWGMAAYLNGKPDMFCSWALVRLFTLGGLVAPVSIAFILIWRSPVLRCDVAGRLVNARSCKPVYWLLALLLMPVSLLLAQLFSLPFGYPLSQFAFSEGYSFSSNIFPIWLLLIAAPATEQLAWHSYGTDSLCARLNLMSASLLFAFFWAIWHIPMAFIEGYYISDEMDGNWVHSANYLLSLFPFAIIMNWIYFKTDRSILAAVVFHVGAGYFNELFQTHPDSKVIQTGLLGILAIVLVLAERDFFFGNLSGDTNRSISGKTL